MFFLKGCCVNLFLFDYFFQVDTQKLYILFFLEQAMSVSTKEKFGYLPVDKLHFVFKGFLSHSCQMSLQTPRIPRFLAFTVFSYRCRFLALMYHLTLKKSKLILNLLEVSSTLRRDQLIFISIYMLDKLFNKHGLMTKIFISFLKSNGRKDNFMRNSKGIFN